MAEEAESITVKGFARPITTYRVRGIYDDLKTEGSIIHHDRNGLRLTVESHGLSDAHRAEAILEEAATELKQ